MHVFKTKSFIRFASHEEIVDEKLCEAVRRAEDGLIDADLGGGVVKQRLAREGKGKSGGSRGIVLFRRAQGRFSSTASLRATRTTSSGTS